MNDREFKATALLAFKSAESPTYEDFIRKVQRWYSRAFATPLTEVEGMADEYLLRHYFEDMYVQLAESDSDESHKAWIETRGRLLKAFDPPAPVPEQAEMTEDEFWEKSLEAEFAEDNPDQQSTESGQKSGRDVQKAPPARHKTESPYDPAFQQIPQNLKVDDEGWTTSEVTPNLQHQDIHIKSDDDIPEDA